MIVCSRFAIVFASAGASDPVYHTLTRGTPVLCTFWVCYDGSPVRGPSAVPPSTPFRWSTSFVVLVTGDAKLTSFTRQSLPIVSRPSVVCCFRVLIIVIYSAVVRAGEVESLNDVRTVCMCPIDDVLTSQQGCIYVGLLLGAHTRNQS